MPEKPPKPPWTPLQLIALGALGAFVVLAALSWSLEPWIPISEPGLVFSQWLRNVGLLVAAIAGLALAVWRGLQTDQQIQQTDRNFKASQEESKRSEDRNTYREAAKLLADQDDSIGFAGVQLLIRLAEESTMENEAADLLNGYVDGAIQLRGISLRDQAVLDWVCTNRPTLAFTDTSFVGTRFLVFAPHDAARELSFSHCEVVDVVFDARHMDPDLVGLEFQSSDVRGAFFSLSDVLMASCSVSISKLQVGGVLKLENCLVYEIADQVWDEDLADRNSAENGLVEFDGMSAVLANTDLRKALYEGTKKHIQLVGDENDRLHGFDETQFFGPGVRIGLPWDKAETLRKLKKARTTDAG
jgi:hypothetical protein